jgi:hypothetical protein
LTIRLIQKNHASIILMHIVIVCILSIPEHFEPGPLARPRPDLRQARHDPYWTGVGRDLEAREIFFGPSPARNTVFSCFTL